MNHIDCVDTEQYYCSPITKVWQIGGGLELYEFNMKRICT